MGRDQSAGIGALASYSSRVIAHHPTDRCQTARPPPSTPTLEKRIRDALAAPAGAVCASLPNSSESIPGQCSGLVALSPPQASPPDDREGHEMKGPKRSVRAHKTADRLSRHRQIASPLRIRRFRRTVRFLRRHEHGRGQAPSFGGVAETFDARNRGARDGLWIFDQVSSGAAERKQETNAPSRSGDEAIFARSELYRS